MATIQGIYLALFGRPADPEGLAYWTEQTNGGQDLTNLIGQLTASEEYQTRYEGKSDTEVITSIYQALFGRAPDAEGLEFFLNALADGTQTFETIAINILDGAQNEDVTVLNNKIEAADLFTASLDTPAEIEAYVGDDAAEIARQFIEKVTGDPQTVPTQDQVDETVTEIVTPGGGQEPGTPPGGGGPTNQPGTVEISGDAEVGQQLTATVTDANGVNESTVNYTWFADGVQVDGGVGVNTYNISAADFGKSITVSVNYVDDDSFNNTASDALDGTVGIGDAEDGPVILFDLITGPSSYDTIQEAVDAADEGATIIVMAGDYVEQVHIDGKTDLTIIGEDGAKIIAPDDLAHNNDEIGTRDRSSVVSVTDSTNVNLRGFDVDGANKANEIPSGTQPDFSGVFYGNSTGSIEDLEVTNVADPRLDSGDGDGHVRGNQRGNAIVIMSDDSGSYAVTLKDNIVSGFQKNGITVSGEGLTAIIQGNEVTGDGKLDYAGAIAQNGIQVSYGANATVTGNTISEIGREAADDWSSSNILLYEAGGSTTVSGNTINGAGGANTVGIITVDSDASAAPGIGENTISGANEYVAVYADNATVPVVAEGSGGPDYFSGSVHGDTFNGGAGNDVIIGGRGDDILNGGDGNDIIWGDNPSDTARDPALFGDDTINGGAGENIIVLGVNAQNMKLGGQDTVIHDTTDGGTDVIFNFNFGPPDRWDSLTGSQMGDNPDGIPAADQVFDILKLDMNAITKISIGQDNSAYGELAGSEGTGHLLELAGNTVYTGNMDNLELVIEMGGSKIVFANAISKWEAGGFLNALDPDPHSPSKSLISLS